MEDVLRKSRTRLKLDSLKYNTPLSRGNSQWKPFGTAKDRHALSGPRTGVGCSSNTRDRSRTDFNQRGFFETDLTVYPQTAPDDSGKAISSSELEWEPGLKWGEWRFNARRRADFESHRMAERKLACVLLGSWVATPRLRDATVERFLVTRASDNGVGKAVDSVGKDGYSHSYGSLRSSRFSHCDRSQVPGCDSRPRHGGKSIRFSRSGLHSAHDSQSNSSSRPALGYSAATSKRIPLLDAGAQYPGGGQYGVRWNHIAKRLENSFSYFRGFNNMPLLEAFFPSSGWCSHRCAAEVRATPNDRRGHRDSPPWVTPKSGSGLV